jgi:stress response protein YsnF
MAHDIDTVLGWRGETVLDRDGEKVGSLKELYLDQEERPAWGAVHTGLFGLRETFVPLSDARPVDGGIQVPFTKDHVKDAPGVDPDAQLSDDEEARLYRHYELPAPDDDAPDRDERDGDERDDDSGRAAAGDAPAEMVRSEEELTVGTRRRVRGKARLKKYVVTEHVQRTVPVQREEVRVEYEPAEGEATEAARAEGEGDDVSRNRGD